MPAEETKMIESLDDFVRVLCHWHTNKVAVLNHMKTIPEGSEVSMDDSAPKVLTGDLLEGFKLGLELALNELGTLPFEAEVEYENVPEEASAEADQTPVTPELPQTTH